MLLTHLRRDHRDDHRLLMTVNLAASVLGRPDLPARMEEVLDELLVDRSRLVLEISESEALEDARTFACLEDLRTLGLALAVDDFGMGYSNLSRLVELAPDIVKLDMSLVRPLADPAAPTRLVSGIIQLAHDLGATVIGEGVETPAQLSTLRDLGCDAVQGFYIGRPALASGIAAAGAHVA